MASDRLTGRDVGKKGPGYPSLCVTCHMSCVTCQVSHVRCHMSHVTFIFYKVLELVSGGCVITGSYPVLFLGFFLFG